MLEVITMFNGLFNNTYINWEDYKAKISFLDEFNWQQSVRKENMRNSKGF
ncbi:hypothetical protein HQ529_03380 [Candidatus Woesearchaeota archaeon]|nr:hypothetical protein [Candidatus Woesearchaeota archaeon]